MRRWARRIVAALGALVALLAAALLLADTAIGHRWIADRIAAIRTDNGLRFSVGRIDGSIYSSVTLIDVRAYDPRGAFAVIPSARLDWRPFRWFANLLDVRALAIPRLSVSRAPVLAAAPSSGPTLPSFDLLIGRLSVDRIDLAPAVTGIARTGRLAGSAELRDGRALVRLDALVEGSDGLHVVLDAQPDRDRFDLAATIRAAADGVLARASGLRRALMLDIAGAGTWRAWRGTARAGAGGARVADLALVARSGAYTVSGEIAPSVIAGGKLRSLSAPRMLVNGRASYADRRLRGDVALRSPSLALDAAGALDFAQNAFSGVRIQARLLRPPALFPNMTARDFTLRAILDGAFAAPHVTYRVDSSRFAFDETGFEDVRATGEARLTGAPVTLPIRLSAGRVTGVGDVAGGILRDFTAEGVLHIDARAITSDDLRIRSDKLTGRLTLRVDLDSGAYQVALTGALGRYLIPGLGVVDIQTELHAVPGPGGHGTRVVGKAAAQVVRLDDAFFRSVAGGLPRLTTGLERQPDGSLRLTGLVLTGPAIRLAGNGTRRVDGSFHFEGGGSHLMYGPLTLKLDGRIDRPTLDLALQRPDMGLGLSEVRAHLDPTPAGFGYRAEGDSKLGGFAAQGRIDLPAAGQATIAVDRLALGEVQASGALAIVPGGVDGRLAVGGGGLSGALAFRPVGEVQRVEAHLEANAARLGDVATLRRGRLDGSVLLDPAGARIEATATGLGLRRGALVLGRFAVNARLTGGRGEVRGEIAGQRGRAFDIQTVVAAAPDRYVINAQGTLDGRPLRLDAPAVIAPEGAGWRLAPAHFTFAGGEGIFAARFSGAGASVEAGLLKMPLAILDIGYPGLGLGGVVSGKVTYAAATGRAPTGNIDVTVRGLTRSGLVVSSRPVDLGVSGVLTADRLGLRAVMGSGGKTIGQAQALLTPLGGGDLGARLSHAPIVAQLRYDGPAETLWRLTGVELFDLTGPVQIAADAGGRLADPSIRGLVRLNGARIESATTGTVLTNVQASGSFGGSKLVIDRIAADAGRGGRVTGAGAFDFSTTRGVGIDLKLQAADATLINTDTIVAAVTGPLGFRSNGVGGTISGDVTLNRSRYRLGQASAAAALPRLAVREVNLPEGGAEVDAPAQPWRLDLRAHAPNALTVSGLGLSSEWSADLVVAGDPANPRITGRANLIRGDVAFAGREFQIQRGVIRFTGETPANPALDIVADGNATNLSASIHVAGTAAKPEISFTSVPALPQDELLSRLLFGTSVTSLSAPEALQLASAVAALQNGKGGLDPINAVRRLAHLDRLRIVPADPSIGQGDAVAAGKYVTRRLYAEIITDGRGYSATQVEFQVTRWLSVLSSISTLGRTTANVRVSKDY